MRKRWATTCLSLAQGVCEVCIKQVLGVNLPCISPMHIEWKSLEQAGRTANGEVGEKAGKGLEASLCHGVGL
jgi:hypothetical protein